MLTRCPGCGKEIEETLDICPHCKRDFSIAVQGTGRRVAPLDDVPLAPKEPPPQAKPIQKAPEPKATPPMPPVRHAPHSPKKRTPGITPPKTSSKPPKEPSAPKDPHDDLPAFMKENLDSPESSAPNEESDLPAHMQAEFEAPPTDSMDDLPAHMKADIVAPPADSLDDSALPPHMRGDALESFSPRQIPQEKSNPMTYVIIGIVFVGGFIFSRLTAKKEAPPPPKTETIVEVSQLEDDVAQKAEEEEEMRRIEAAKKEEAERTAAEESQKKKAHLKFSAPPIDDSLAPPISTPASSTRKSQNHRSPRRSPPSEPPAKPNDPKHDKWRIRSKVLNLITLEPVADAKIGIYDIQSGKRFPTATGEDGAFRKTIPSNTAGYKLLFQHDEYETKFLPSSAYPFQSMDEDQRKKIADKLKQFTEPISPLIGDGEGFIKETFYLLPREKHGMSLEDALDR